MSGNSPPTESAPSPPVLLPRGERGASRVGARSILFHLCRVALFIGILVIIRWGGPSPAQTATDLELDPLAQQFVQDNSPSSQIEPWQESKQGWPISNQDQPKGLLIQTSPQSDSIIGYSGSTNCLVLINEDQSVASVRILHSGDTVDHVRALKEDETFFDSFGATLTSHAIVASVARRIDGSNLSLKFDATPSMENVRKLFPDATRLDQSKPSAFVVFGANGPPLGQVLMTTPWADDLSGYQGPTAALLGFVEGKCIGVVVDQTYENQPYASYLDDDVPLQKLYRDKSLLAISVLTPESEGIDGVSGATMTSLCVAEGIAIAAKNVGKPPGNIPLRKAWSWWIDGVTILLTAVGLLMSLNWIKLKKLRWLYLLAVIVFVGFVGGQMLSQALFVGWAKSSIPWQVAPGLVVLAAVSLITPAVSKHQPYCHQICPFGAMQQLARNRVAKQNELSKRLRSILAYLGSWIPFGLLALTVWAACTRSGFNLASIEPFDAFSFRVAGWATIGVFVVGMVSSLFSPMAYCRHGCPTGSVLDWLKFRGDSEKLGLRDLAAVVLLVLTLVLSLTQ